jgi:hypothetical protein
LDDFVLDAQSGRPHGERHRHWIFPWSYQALISVGADAVWQSPAAEGKAQIGPHLLPRNQMTLLG